MNSKIKKRIAKEFLLLIAMVAFSFIILFGFYLYSIYYKSRISSLNATAKNLTDSISLEGKKFKNIYSELITNCRHESGLWIPSGTTLDSPPEDDPIWILKFIALKEDVVTDKFVVPQEQIVLNEDGLPIPKPKFDPSKPYTEVEPKSRIDTSKVVWDIKYFVALDSAANVQQNVKDFLQARINLVLVYKQLHQWDQYIISPSEAKLSSSNTHNDGQPILAPWDQAKLDDIVQQMISNGESESIQAVVNDFKNKYSQRVPDSAFKSFATNLSKQKLQKIHSDLSHFAIPIQFNHFLNTIGIDTSSFHLIVNGEWEKHINRIQSLRSKISENQNSLTYIETKVLYDMDFKLIYFWIITILLLFLYPVRFIVLMTLWSIKILRR